MIDVVLQPNLTYLKQRASTLSSLGARKSFFMPYSWDESQHLQVSTLPENGGYSLWLASDFCSKWGRVSQGLVDRWEWDGGGIPKADLWGMGSDANTGLLWLRGEVGLKAKLSFLQLIYIPGDTFRHKYSNNWKKWDHRYKPPKLSWMSGHSSRSCGLLEGLWVAAPWSWNEPVKVLISGGIHKAFNSSSWRLWDGLHAPPGLGTPQEAFRKSWSVWLWKIKCGQPYLPVDTLIVIHGGKWRHG